MNMLINLLARPAIGILLATSAPAQSVQAQNVHAVTGPTPFLPIANEPDARLFVDQPLPEPLARGVALIPYRTENFRILPVFGPSALNVSPRAGHLHVTVDDLPWHWADAGANNTIVVAGLRAGEHKVLIELATPDHRVILGQTVTFTVPAAAGHASGH